LVSLVSPPKKGRGVDGGENHRGVDPSTADLARRLSAVPPSSQPYECRRRRFPENKNSPRDNSFVCVCDANYCDQPAPWQPAELADGRTMLYYLTSKSDHRLQKMVANFTREEEKKTTAVGDTMNKSMN
jgi:hypothetical protein